MKRNCDFLVTQNLGDFKIRHALTHLSVTINSALKQTICEMIIILDHGTPDYSSMSVLLNFWCIYLNCMFKSYLLSGRKAQLSFSRIN